VDFLIPKNPLWVVHFFSFFCDKKRKETEPKKRKKNATVGQGFTLKPEICLMSRLIKQKPSPRGCRPELALGREKSVFSFWLLFLFSSIKKRKSNNKK